MKVTAYLQGLVSFLVVCSSHTFLARSLEHLPRSSPGLSVWSLLSRQNDTHHGACWSSPVSRVMLQTLQMLDEVQENEDRGKGMSDREWRLRDQKKPHKTQNDTCASEEIRLDKLVMTHSDESSRSENWELCVNLPATILAANATSRGSEEAMSDTKAERNSGLSYSMSFWSHYLTAHWQKDSEK